MIHSVEMCLCSDRAVAEDTLRHIALHAMFHPMYPMALEATEKKSIYSVSL